MGLIWMMAFVHDFPSSFNTLFNFSCAPVFRRRVAFSLKVMHASRYSVVETFPERCEKVRTAGKKMSPMVIVICDFILGI